MAAARPNMPRECHTGNWSLLGTGPPPLSLAERDLAAAASQARWHSPISSVYGARDRLISVLQIGSSPPEDSLCRLRCSCISSSAFSDVPDPAVLNRTAILWCLRTRSEITQRGFLVHGSDRPWSLDGLAKNRKSCCRLLRVQGDAANAVRRPSCEEPGQLIHTVKDCRLITRALRQTSQCRSRDNHRTQKRSECLEKHRIGPSCIPSKDQPRCAVLVLREHTTGISGRRAMPWKSIAGVVSRLQQGLSLLALSAESMLVTDAASIFPSGSQATGQGDRSWIMRHKLRISSRQRCSLRFRLRADTPVATLLCRRPSCLGRSGVVQSCTAVPSVFAQGW